MLLDPKAEIFVEFMFAVKHHSRRHLRYNVKFTLKRLEGFSHFT